MARPDFGIEIQPHGLQTATAQIKIEYDGIAVIWTLRAHSALSCVSRQYFNAAAVAGRGVSHAIACSE